MGLDPITGPLLTIALVGAGASTAMSMASAGARADEAQRAREAAERAAANQDIGDLSPEEMQLSASKKLFRQGLYFTSPTGTLTGGTRGRSRLMGA